MRSGHVARFLPTFVARSLGGSAFNGRSMRTIKLAEILGSTGAAGRTYAILRAMFTVPQVLHLAPHLRSELAEELDAHDAVAMRSTGDDVGTYSQLELSGYLRNTLLRDRDTMSMAHSVEVRVPLLDHELAECVLSLPREVKLTGRWNKPLMVAAAPRLPDAVVHRDKMGFTLPLEVWFRGAGRARLADVFQTDWNSGDVIKKQTMERMWKLYDERSPSMSFWRIWSLATLKEWCIRNDVAACM